MHMRSIVALYFLPLQAALLQLPVAMIQMIDHCFWVEMSSIQQNFDRIFVFDDDQWINGFRKVVP